MPEYEQQWQESERELLTDYVARHRLHLRANNLLFLDAAMPLPGELDAAYGGIHKILAAPMFLADQFLGLLSIDYGNEDRASSIEEQTLIRAVARLLILVIERDRLLQERAMARANELALREANRRMDEFLGMASHELRSPLTSIKANIQIAERRIRLCLQEEENASESLVDKLTVAQELLLRADSQIGQLNRVVSDLLDVSRIRSNRMELQLNPAPCDLIPTVQGIVREQREVYPLRTILLNLPPEDHIFVLVDANRIGQVVTNYLTNAVRYSPTDRPIKVSLWQERERVIVSVRDQGPGIPSSEHERIWERFYRVKNIKTLNNNGVGLGLGLHICKMIITLHHGEVGVQSTPGEGATFWFKLPLIRLE
jgi:signal transduction histidine kinase